VAHPSGVMGYPKATSSMAWWDFPERCNGTSRMVLPVTAASFLPEVTSPLPMTAADQMAWGTSVRMMAAMDRTQVRT